MYKKRIKHHRFVCFGLSLFLLFASFMSFEPAFAEEGFLEISTIKQLQELSKKCSVESYSLNLRVKLLNDLDFKGSEFSPFAFFHGSFDGQGYEIKQFKITGESPNLGFFRTLGESAEIKDLILSGEVRQSGKGGSAGILTGENHGIIAGCTVKGSVAGPTDIGSIAGINNGGGLITGCTSEAFVNGTLRVGGITGNNLGEIEGCKNTGEVNTTIEEDISPVNFSNGSKSNLWNEDMFSDVGGICGKNVGSVRKSENNAVVGQELSGENIGGIAGTHKGLIVSCKNTAAVYGGRNVGGIAGFFTPDIALSFDGERGAALDTELLTLSIILANLSDVLSSIPAHEGASEDLQKAIENIGSTLSRHGIEADNRLFKTLGSIHDFLQTISAGTDNISSLSEDFSSLAADEISEMRTELNVISPAAIEAELSEDLGYLTTELGSIESQIIVFAEAADKFKTLSQGFDSSLNDDTLSELQKKDSIITLINSYKDAADESALISDSVSNIYASFSVINRSMNVLNKTLAGASAETATGLSSLTAATARFQRSFTDFSLAIASESESIVYGIEQTELTLNRYLSVTELRLRLTFEEIYSSLSFVKTLLEELSPRVLATQYELSALVDSAKIQLDLIGVQAQGMLTEVEHSSIEASATLEFSERPGQISASRNSGNITAGENAGGVTGLMAKLDSFGEDIQSKQYLWSEKPSLFRAVLMTSVNSGGVTVEKDAAGGIVGRCEIGLIYKAESNAVVKSASGSYCGGVAGISRTSIIQSSAMGALYGDDYLGGVSGYGQNISNCRSMVLVNGKGENKGSIAGYALGEIVGNAFVDEGLGGIGGESIAGMAYPLSYESFTALDDLPIMFTQLHADFYIDGKLLKRVGFVYDGSIPSWKVPSLPNSGEGFGEWEIFNSANLRRSFRVNAVFSPWLESISSGGDDPLLLAEGKFSNGAFLTTTEVRTPIFFEKTYRPVFSFSYRIEDENGEDGSQYRLRLLCEDPKSVVLILVNNGEETKTSFSRSGKYLVFTAPAEAEIIVLEPLAGRLIAVGFIILSVLVALGFFWYTQRRFSRTQGKEK